MVRVRGKNSVGKWRLGFSGNTDRTSCGSTEYDTPNSRGLCRKMCSSRNNTHFFLIFWVIFQCSAIIGNLLLDHHADTCTDTYIHTYTCKEELWDPICYIERTLEILSREKRPILRSHLPARVYSMELHIQTPRTLHPNFGMDSSFQLLHANYTELLHMFMALHTPTKHIAWNMFYKYTACNIFVAQCTLRKYILHNLL